MHESTKSFLIGVVCGCILAALCGLGLYALSASVKAQAKSPGIDFPIEWVSQDEKSLSFARQRERNAKQMKLWQMKRDYEQWLVQRTGKQPSEADIDAIVAETTPNILDRLDPY